MSFQSISEILFACSGLAFFFTGRSGLPGIEAHLPIETRFQQTTGYPLLSGGLRPGPLTWADLPLTPGHARRRDRERRDRPMPARPPSGETWET